MEILPEVRVAVLAAAADSLIELAMYTLEHPRLNANRQVTRLRAKVVHWACEFDDRSLEMWPYIAASVLSATESDEGSLTARERHMRQVALRVAAVFGLPPGSQLP